MTTDTTPRPPATTPRPLPLQAVMYGTGAIVLFLAARSVLAPLGLVGNVVAQWGFLVLPVVAPLLLTGVPVGRALGFRRVRPGILVGGTLVALGTLPLNGVVAWVQSFFMEVPIETLEAMAQVLAAGSALEWAIIILAASVTPSFCEEIVFRGILLHPFRGRVPGWLVVGAGSLAFGVMHWMPGTAFRVLPAAFSGAMIGWMVWVTRSLWTGVWMHLVNNTLLLTLAAFAADVVPENPSTDPNPAAVLFGLLFVVFGARLVFATLRDEESPPGEAEKDGEARTPEWEGGGVDPEVTG